MKKYINKSDKDHKRSEFMTQDEMREVDDRLSKLTQNAGEMNDLYDEWGEIEDYYQNNQEEKDKRPNTKVNILSANIEGQVSALTNQSIAVMCRGEGASDQDYADWARIGLDWTLRKNYIKRVLDVHERRRLKFGAGILKAYFDPDAVSGFGLAKVFCPPLNKIFIDQKIKDPLRFQEAEYIAETIRLGKEQFKLKYGEAKANLIDYGTFEIENTIVFPEDKTDDDEDSATLVQWWERHEGKLRLLEFTTCGVLLYDSHKKGERKDNQKNSKYDHKSYYSYVNNKYPYFFTPLYPSEGNLWGFGDGKLILPLQKMINDLYDKIRICARPNLILFDTNSMIDLEDFDENSLEPRPFEGQAGMANPVQTVPWGTINESWWRLLSSIHQEVQRVTRFSSLMMGQGGTSETATEASIQQQQGNATTDHKNVLLQSTMVELCEYILGLMMDNYTEGKTFRISEDKESYEWIDFRELTKVPVKRKPTDAFIKQWNERHPDKELPKWELLTESNGKPMTKTVDLDIEINVGAGLPKNKTFVYQMIEKLSGITLPDLNGQPKPLISWDEMRKFVQDFLGVPLMDESEMKSMSQPQQPNTPTQEPMLNADSNLSANGNPQLSQLSMIRGGMNG